MPFPKTTQWVILGTKGAVGMRAKSAIAAARAFEKAYRDGEIHAVFLSDIVQMPPRDGDPLPFRCSIMGPGKIAS
jgi:hypothetical protein